MAVQKTKLPMQTVIQENEYRQVNNMTDKVNRNRRGVPSEVDTSYELPEMVGLQEVSEIAKKPKSVIMDRMLRGKFPEPLEHLSSGPVWVKEDVERFLRSSQWDG